MLDSVAYFIVLSSMMFIACYVVKFMSLLYARRCSIISNNYIYVT